MSTKYEHLLSVDPIGAFEKVKENYKRYFQSAYVLRTELSQGEDSAIDDERVQLLDKGDNLYKSPYIEMMPEYESAKGIQSVADLAEEYVSSFGSRDCADLFFKFIKCGLMNYPPYGHQVEMLQKAFGEKHNAVITSGTGSGKTESFLLPLLAQIFKEALTWPQANYDPAWFAPQGRAKTQYSPRQRSNKNRDAAIRAIVLYPMNALVEDQVRRLREALDSTDVRALFDTKFQGNRIFFGQYNGSTIGQKSFDLLQQGNGSKFIRAKKRVLEELNKLKVFYDTAQAELSDPNCPEDQKKDLEYITARLDGQTSTAEMLTRWDMQECPPDILITNISMLSIMLMRSAEEKMIKQTHDWLANDPWRKNEAEEPTRIFHIIVDELHLYRGTAGSEVGCLLRMLLHQLGLKPVIERDGKKIPNPQLRILASSASLGDEKETKEFLQQFFGVYSEDEKNHPSFVVQEGSDYKPISNHLAIPYGDFAKIDPSFIELSDQDQHDRMDIFMKSLGYLSVEDFIIKHQENIFLDFKKATHPKTDLSGIRIDDLYGTGSNALFPNKESLRGFLIFRAYVDRYVKYIKKHEDREIRHRLPRFRFHQFFKYIEGLWGELNPTIDANAQPTQTEPVVNLAYQPREIGLRKNRMLELLRCECCGQLYIGGNVDRSKNTLHLSLNVPDLDKIPSFNPTPMVQNKSYDEYAIFYPTHNQNVQLEDQEDHCTNISDMEVTNSAKVEWKHACLIPETGEINETIQPNSIEGYICELTTSGNTLDGKKILALPCTCPHCHMDYQSREYTKSPIRSFRTGIDRSNQILSKELMYQLTTPKLIGFSDSREDAAKQSFGIANEHYRDMVRMLFVKKVEEKIEQANANDPNKILKDVTDLVDRLRSEGKSNREIKNEVKDIYGDQGRTWADEYLEDGSVPPIPFNHIDTVSIEGFADKNGPLVEALLETGINPDGVSTSGKKWWSDAYNYYRTDGKVDDATPLTSLATAIFNNSFGLYMGVSVTDTGIGYLCVNPKKLANLRNKPQIQALENLLNGRCNTQDFLDSFLRVMGDCHRFRSEANGYRWVNINSSQFFKSAMKRFVAKVAQKLGSGCNQTKLGKALYDAMTLLGFNGMEIKIPSTLTTGNADIPHMAFRMLDPDAHYYYCPNCHRVHPIAGIGICTRCGADLKHSARTNKDLRRHYISYDIKEERREPSRLHTEELTGQTDDIQERLRLFKDLVLESDGDPETLHGRKATQPIDMISVTTTMEVGVDIGSLEAIYQGNMSPTRYNYQQRVGRGGRRGQAFATAFTFCRGRSHDLYYYEKATERIVGGKPATPTLSLAPYMDSTGWHIKQSIMKRVIAKHILRDAITDMYNPDLHDTVAEFGRVADWYINARQKVVNTLSEKDFAKNIVDYYISQFNTSATNISADYNAILNWTQDINKGLVKDIDDVVDNYHDSEVGLGQCLAEMGILPKYGMPFDVRDFYHGYNERKESLCTIDRSSEMAITEFAPGAEKTKDKGIYTVEGICVPMIVDSDGNPQYIDSNADALENRHILTFDHDQNIIDIDHCYPTISFDSINNNQKILVIPKAYRTREIRGNNGKRIDNNDRRTRYASSDIFAKEGEGTSKHVKNCEISAFGFSDNEAEIWHVNTNNLRFYKGQYGGLGDPPTDGATTTYAFDINNNNDDLQLGQHLIALGSRKVTEMISLRLKQHPSCLDLNCVTGNRAAIRAAYISAAFLLQRTLADILDVEPREIEVIEKIKDNVPLIYLSDALPNGAGIVEYLYQKNHLEEVIKKIVDFQTPFMQSLIDDEHRKKCLTACQECLNAYDNRGYHHILDWRMGVGLLRLMIDPNYDFGFDKANRSKAYPEIEDYDDVFDAAKIKIGGQWNDHLYSVSVPQNRGIDVQNILNPQEESTSICKVLYHPLWSRPALMALLPNADQYEYHNLFKVLRSDLTPDQSQTPFGTSSPTNQSKSTQPTHQQGTTMQEESNSQEDGVVDETTGVVLDIDL